MINLDEEKIKRAREIVFNTKTKEQLDALLLETEKELKNPNVKLYTLEEMKEMTRRMMNETKKIPNKVS